MRLYALRLSSIKLQHPMLGGTMPTLAHVANLNASASPVPVTAHGPGRKPHRIPRSLPWQLPTTLRIAKVAELPQFLMRWKLTLMSRRRALPTPPAS